ncbi:MAG: sugar transferase [Gammaproteobacteria bacterium]|nr:sugar transferase [Gammaproteobacteria bacterium]
MYPLFKRIIDIVISLLAIVFLAPVFVILYILISFYLGQPVIFKQLRPGYKGKPFALYKFRSMINMSNEEGGLKSDEQRITPLGKWLRSWSLDEWPQLVNVLKGDLSLVGPRPLLMEYLGLYNSEQARRHNVRPGITGLAQVKGRNSLSWNEKFHWDIEYVDHCSFILDLKILFWTIQSVFNRRGIHQDGHVTMPPFRGNKNHE